MTDRPTITALYAEHASPDNIRIEIKKAKATAARWQRHVDGLTALLDTRLEQIDAGTWPPAMCSEYVGDQLHCARCGVPFDEHPTERPTA